MSILIRGLVILLFIFLSSIHKISADTLQINYPILFVTQTPIPSQFLTNTSVFGNHITNIKEVGRGGDLYILYPNGTLKNLTQLAGYGMTGLQGQNSIAVREPCVHWNGQKAIFSMVVGAPAQNDFRSLYYWQLYEITGLGQSETPVITKVANQPANFNNVSPIYGTNERIIFVSDRPRTGESHLYPQLDEYDMAPTNTGIWSLDPNTGDLVLLHHSPSGAFSLSLDSFGRVIFARWDHLQRDKQADDDILLGNTFGTFNYSDETAQAQIIRAQGEVFPEPRPERTDLLIGTNFIGHTFNHFSPWQMNEDGTDAEIVNHLGRHEFKKFFNPIFNDDPNLKAFSLNASNRVNRNYVFNILQIKEDPVTLGNYYAVDAPNFKTHAAGQIIRFNASISTNPDQTQITYITNKATSSFSSDTEAPNINHSGLYRNPLPLSNGNILTVHTPETRADMNEGTLSNPLSRYDFRLKILQASGNEWIAGAALTPGISKTISYYDPKNLINFSGLMWELDPIEVKPRTKPRYLTSVLPDIEKNILTEEHVNEIELRNYLKSNNLAMIVGRNVTTRDQADLQQPFNLRVAGTNTQTIRIPRKGFVGKIYDVAFLQFFQADQIRGKGLVNGKTVPRPGRRVLAQPLHDPNVNNLSSTNGPIGNVQIATDGSVAAFVPANRAITWQLTDSSGSPVILERYWLSFQAGEIRSCTSCHGINTRDQAQQTPPQNPPEAFRQLLQYWKSLQSSGNLFRNAVIQSKAMPGFGADQAIDGNLTTGFEPQSTKRTQIIIQLNQKSDVAKLRLYINNLSNDNLPLDWTIKYRENKKWHTLKKGNWDIQNNQWLEIEKNKSISTKKIKINFKTKKDHPYSISEIQAFS